MLKTTLEQWRMFKAVVNYGGFSQASQAIHKSQSTIHHAVQKLEESLGVTLLEVVGRKAQLTAAGEMMLRRSSYLLEEAEKIEALAGTIAQGVETHLRIAIDEAFPRKELYQAIESVSDQYPLLRIELFETILSGANELVTHGKVDLGISSIIDHAGFSEEICQLEFVAVACPNFPLTQLPTPLSFEDIKSYRQIVVRDSAQSASIDSGWLGAEQRWTVSHLSSSIDLVCKGFGFAWQPYASIEQHIKEGRLQLLNLQHGSKRYLKQYLHFIDADKLGPAANAFIKALRHQTQHLPTSEKINAIQ
ncbi:LysR family transcriptional regulator [Marinibactrum halimedae]|uniref:LysR family transcriptional regulator n=1 Tax=Marinibactrum halimedae TaxID=1444977 RepID=A0AA37WKA7_9GAMM|nr:LysR family transcriptional regulator [Marinibactrum halimedae]MCD9459121.1 LysR family transcriptional regulator [Marinibactrum halimedae]GLS24723.1 LysR family transcriptional regulator [Marinibactrum halimedae]